LNESPPVNTENNKLPSNSNVIINNNSSNSSSNSNANNQVINRDMMMIMSDNNHKIENMLSSFLSNGYDQLISILTSENKLCERKLIIFNNKRIEEENKKLTYMKKIAKSKQLEEVQSLDPANFRNQKNF
jgi:hypothetical protein